MARIEVHLHAWPLFITVMPERFDMRDVEAYIAQVEPLYRRQERFATLVDTTAIAALPGAAERRRLADWQNDTVDSIRRYNVCTATVVRSPLVRGAMTAMSWIFPPPNLQFAVPTFAEGFGRCVEELSKAGLAVPSAVRERVTPGGPRDVLDTRPKAS